MKNDKKFLVKPVSDTCVLEDLLNEMYEDGYELESIELRRALDLGFHSRVTEWAIFKRIEPAYIYGPAFNTAGVTYRTKEDPAPDCTCGGQYGDCKEKSEKAKGRVYAFWAQNDHDQLREELQGDPVESDDLGYVEIEE